jgi:hypothetical protein
MYRDMVDIAGDIAADIERDWDTSNPHYPKLSRESIEILVGLYIEYVNKGEFDSDEVSAMDFARYEFIEVPDFYLGGYDEDLYDGEFPHKLESGLYLVARDGLADD